MMKRGWNAALLACSFVFAIITITALVSAYFDITDPYSYTGGNILDVLRNFLESIFSDYRTDSQIFFIKILLFIIVFVISKTALKATPKIGESSGIVNLIAVIVGILAIKWLTPDMVEMIMLPYGTLGIALATILPFMVFFYFVHATNMGGVGRRLSWVLFALCFFAVFYNRYSTISQTGRYFYLAILIVIILAFLFDRGIHNYFFLHELSGFFRRANQRAIAHAQAEYMRLKQSGVDTPEAKAELKRLEKELKGMGSNAP